MTFNWSLFVSTLLSRSVDIKLYFLFTKLFPISCSHLSALPSLNTLMQLPDFLHCLITLEDWNVSYRYPVSTWMRYRSTLSVKSQYWDAHFNLTCTYEVHLYLYLYGLLDSAHGKFSYSIWFCQGKDMPSPGIRTGHHHFPRHEDRGINITSQGNKKKKKVRVQWVKGGRLFHWRPKQVPNKIWGIKASIFFSWFFRQKENLELLKWSMATWVR